MNETGEPNSIFSYRVFWIWFFMSLLSILIPCGTIYGHEIYTNLVSNSSNQNVFLFKIIGKLYKLYVYIILQIYKNDNDYFSKTQTLINTISLNQKNSSVYYYSLSFIESDILFFKVTNLTQLCFNPINSVYDPNFLRFRYSFKTFMKSETDSSNSLFSTTIKKYSEKISSVCSFMLFAFIGFVAIMIALILFSISLCQRQYDWFYGASVLVKREMFNQTKQTYYIVDTLLDKLPNYFEDIPYASIIRKSDGLILYANNHVPELNHHTVEQTIGQYFQTFFNVDRKYLFLVYHFPNPYNDYEFVIIQNIKKFYKLKEIYDLLIKKSQNINIKQFSIKQKLLSLKIYCIPNQEMPSLFYDAINQSENAYPNIVPLSCTSSLFVGVSQVQYSKDAMLFILDFIKFMNNYIIALTEGDGVVITLENDSILPLLCGEAGKRSEELVTNGVLNRIYIETPIVQKIGRDNFDDIIENYPNIMEISPI